MSESDDAFGFARWLSLAAAPTFGAMALMTAMGDEAPPMICSAQHASAVGGMTMMYALMSAFHGAQWLRLLPSGRRAAPRS